MNRELILLQCFDLFSAQLLATAIVVSVRDPFQDLVFMKFRLTVAVESEFLLTLQTRTSLLGFKSHFAFVFNLDFSLK